MDPDEKPETAMISGLEDVVAAETVLSEVDGQAGRLVIRGHFLDDLVSRATYEDVLNLLWRGFFQDSPDDVRLELGLARREVFEHLQAADAPLLKQSTVDAIRALVARLADGNDVKSALRLVAAPAVFTPGVVRLQRGLAPVAPDSTAGHAADVLRMLHNKQPTPEQTSALDRYLITVRITGSMLRPLRHGS